MLRKVLKRKQDNLKSEQKMRWWKKEAQEKLHTVVHRDHLNLAKDMKVMIMRVEIVSLSLVMMMMI